MEGKIRWCFKIKDGLKIAEPNENLSKSYFNLAKSSLLKAEKDLNEKDLLWATVAIYYAEYYALYSFLQKIGIKCENHFCSINLIGLLLGENKTKTINEHKDRRIDAQYYLKIGQEDKIKIMLQEAKIFVSEFSDIISNLTKEEIAFYRKKLDEFK